MQVISPKIQIYDDNKEIWTVVAPNDFIDSNRAVTGHHRNDNLSSHVIFFATTSTSLLTFKWTTKSQGKVQTIIPKQI